MICEAAPRHDDRWSRFPMLSNLLSREPNLQPTAACLIGKQKGENLAVADRRMGRPVARRDRPARHGTKVDGRYRAGGCLWNFAQFRHWPFARQSAWRV